ncbi:MAG: O-antigen ligase family protein [Bacteroidaceae bacterium]|nr:O-antigen ligase family protein [Bacteroidaceae bacterium]
MTLLVTMGYLLYFMFPFPPIIWRLLFVVIALIATSYRINELEKHEKLAIVFLCFNLLYFIISFNWLKNPSFTQIGNIICTLLAIPLFTSLGRKGVFTNKFIIVSFILLFIAGIGYFIDGFRVATDLQGNNDEEVTNNSGTVFLFLLPFILCVKNKILSFIAFVLCILFLLFGAKRGNLVCAVIPCFLFVKYILTDRGTKIREKILLFILLIVSCFIFMSQIEGNDYLLERIDDTVEGDSSNRDYIYAKAWGIWANSEYFYNMLLGYGYDTTVNHPAMKIHAHSDWLEILVNYGLIGIVFYFLILKDYIKQIFIIKGKRKKYVLISIVSIWFVKSIFSMGFTSPIMFVNLFFMGYVYSFNGYKNFCKN